VLGQLLYYDDTIVHGVPDTATKTTA
jgi:hypothetical protein